MTMLENWNYAVAHRHDMREPLSWLAGPAQTESAAAVRAFARSTVAAV
jgi:hypothetical protein